MDPQPLDQESNPDPGARPTLLPWWALLLALTALGLDTLAWAAGEGDDGRGWAFAFPLVCGNNLAALACAGMAACCAVARLSCRWRDRLAWLALGLSAGAAWAAVLMIERSFAHVAAV